MADEAREAMERALIDWLERAAVKTPEAGFEAGFLAARSFDATAAKALAKMAPAHHRLCMDAGLARSHGHAGTFDECGAKECVSARAALTAFSQELA